MVVEEEVAQAGGFFEAELFCGLVHRAFCFADVLLDGGRCEVGCRRLRYGDFAEGFGEALDGGAAGRAWRDVVFFIVGLLEGAAGGCGVEGFLDGGGDFVGVHDDSA